MVGDPGESANDHSKLWRVVEYSLGRSWVVLGVVSNLGTSWALELEFGSLVGTQSLSIRTDPLLAGSFLVDLVELFLVWLDLLGNLYGTAGKDISANDAEVRDEFTGLAVGDEEGDEGS